MRRRTAGLVVFGLGALGVAAVLLWPGLFWRAPGGASDLEALDYRIETALPRDRGLAATPEVASMPGVRVELTMVGDAPPGERRTRVRVGDLAREIEVPVWTHDRAKDLEIEAALDREWLPVREEIARLHAAHPDWLGQIECPRTQETVPHVDVIRALDCFLAVGIKEVNFVGQAFPLPKRK